MNDLSPLIEINNFHKAYGDTVAVSGLSVTVEPGEVVGLVGPNGAGKTTTLSALSGILPPTSGTLHIAGHDIVKEPVAAKSRLAYVPDDPNLFETLTVWEHIQFVAAAYRLVDYEARAEKLLEVFELTPKRDALAGELSHGMRQKAAICCAYLHEPKVMLFDEPLTGLDPRGIRNIKEAILRFAESGAAVIISSHLLSLVEDLCSHLLILHHGERLYLGSIADARKSFEGLDDDASLEEVFFHATESGRSGAHSA